MMSAKRAKMRETLTAERLRELLEYDPLTGVFCWKVSRGKARVGSEAGTLNSASYQQIGIDRRLYLTERLAWFWMTAEWPKGLVDHRDRDTLNNRWDNLRLSTHSQNAANSKARSGLKGVTSKGRRFQAAIRANGRSLHLEAPAVGEVTSHRGAPFRRQRRRLGDDRIDGIRAAEVSLPPADRRDLLARGGDQ
jgi:hypothetical protein